MSISLAQNFYKETVKTAWVTGAGDFYVTEKPTISSGYLVLSPSSASLREIVKFTATGSDGGGDYVTITAPNRGLGGTSDQTHAIGESILMNITAEHIAEISAEFGLKLDDTQLDTDGTLAADSDDKIATQKATKTYADTKVGLSGNDSVAGVKTFSVSPVVPTPITDYQVSTKKYADDLAIAGAPNASETLQGLVEEATEAEVLAKTDVGGTGAKLFVPPSKLPVAGTIDVYNAYEDLAAGDAVGLSYYTPATYTLSDPDTTQTIDGPGTNMAAQRFTYEGNEFVRAYITVATATSDIDISIRSTLTGADIVSDTVAAIIGANTISLNISAAGLTYGDDYYMVLGENVSDAGGTPSVYVSNDGTPPTGGTDQAWYSSNGGTNWTTLGTGKILNVQITRVNNALGHQEIFKSSAAALDNRLGFIGFATETVTAGNPVTVDTRSITNLHTGLTDGVGYYLSDTDGAISTTAGTRKLFLGAAHGTTKLVRPPYNQHGFEIAVPYTGFECQQAGLISINAAGYIYTLSQRANPEAEVYTRTNISWTTSEGTAFPIAPGEYVNANNNGVTLHFFPDINSHL